MPQNLVSVTPSDIIGMLYETEASDTASKLTSFSTPSTGANSTYAFGPVQVDVGSNPTLAGTFLMNHGFSASQVQELESSTLVSNNELSTLNSELQAIPATVMAQFQQSIVSGYITQLNNVIQAVAAVDPTNAASIESSPLVQLSLIDYMNEYPHGIQLTSTSGMLVYLEGLQANPSGNQSIQITSPGVTVANIAAFLAVTKYSTQAKTASAAATRVVRLQTALSQYSSGNVVLPAAYGNNNSSMEDGISSLATTAEGLTGTVTVGVDSSDNFIITGANGYVSTLLSSIPTYQLNVDASESSFDFALDANANVYGSNNSLQSSAGSTLNLAANTTNDSITANNSTINMASSNGVIANIGGSNNSITVANDPDATIGVTGADQVVNTSGAVVNVGTDAVVTINGTTTVGICGTNEELDVASNGSTINTIGDATGNVVTSNDSTLNAAAGYTGFWIGADNTLNFTADSGTSVALFNSGNELNSTGNSFYLASAGITDDISGTNTVGMNASDDAVSLGSGGGTVNVASGLENIVIYATDTTIDAAGNSHVIVCGSYNKVIANSGDEVMLYGSHDDVYGSDLSVGYVRGAVDDHAYGGDNSSGYGYGGGEYAALTTVNNHKPTSAQIAGAVGSGDIYENASWTDKTIMWSFSGATGGDSDVISDPAEEALVKQAFQAWSKASGLDFVEVANGSPAAIQVGFGDLDTASTNTVGQTQLESPDGNIVSANIELEDPNQLALTTNANGQLAYAGTNTSFEQDALHEIGHALGLADNDIAGSIMNAVLSQGNQTLNASDTTNIQNLYGVTGSASESSFTASQLHQLTQAMNGFDASDLGLDQFTPELASATAWYQRPSVVSHIPVHLAA